MPFIEENLPSVNGGEVEAQVTRDELLLLFGGHDGHVLLKGKRREKDVASVGREHFSFARDEPACVEFGNELDETGDRGDAD